MTRLRDLPPVVTPFSIEPSPWYEVLPHGLRHTIFRPAFWLGLTLGFPLEHFLWEKVWPFYLITRWLGL